MVTLYAGIKAIPGEVLEAAALDGASALAHLAQRHGADAAADLVVVTIQSIIWDFKVFTQIYVMTNGGGIAGQNLVLNVYAYQKAFASSEYGLGSAIGVVMLLILLARHARLSAALRRRERSCEGPRRRGWRIRPAAWRLAAESSAVADRGGRRLPALLDGAVRAQAGGRDPVRPTPGRGRSHPTLDRFRRVFEQQNFGRYFLNSLLVALASSSPRRWSRSSRRRR